MLWIILGILISYLIGSIPTAYILGRFLKGIDIRKFGSGNVGATNALRVLGKPAGITVLILDILKGFIVVVFLGDILALRTAGIPDETLRVALSLSCICGHNWTVFLRFQGGKGMASTFGVLLGLAFKIEGFRIILGMCILVWILIFVITKIVSLASVLTGVTLLICMILFRQSNLLVLLSIVLSIFIVLRHRANLKRLWQGKEPRFK